MMFFELIVTICVILSHCFVDAVIPDILNRLNEGGFVDQKTKSVLEKVRKDDKLLTFVLTTPFHIKLGYKSKNGFVARTCSFDELHELVRKLERDIISTTSKVVGVRLELKTGHLIPDEGFFNPLVRNNTDTPANEDVAQRKSSLAKTTASSKQRVRPPKRRKPTMLSPTARQKKKPNILKTKSKFRPIMKQQPTPSPTIQQLVDLSPTSPNFSPTYSLPTAPSVIPSESNQRMLRRRGRNRFVWGGWGAFRCRGCRGDNFDHRRLFLHLLLDNIVKSIPEETISQLLGIAVSHSYRKYLWNTNQRTGCLGDGKAVITKFRFLE